MQQPQFKLILNGSKFDLQVGEQILNAGLSEAQVSAMLPWTHCPGPHKGFEVNSHYIAKAGIGQVAIATGEVDGVKTGIKIYEAADTLCMIGPLTALCHQVFDEANPHLAGNA